MDKKYMRNSNSLPKMNFHQTINVVSAAQGWLNKQNKIQNKLKLTESSILLPTNISKNQTSSILLQNLQQKQLQKGNQPPNNNHKSTNSIYSQTGAFDPTKTFTSSMNNINDQSTLKQFYSTAYLNPSFSLNKLTQNNDRVPKIKSISCLSLYELYQTYKEQSLPVIKQMKQMQKKWGNERSRPDYDIRDKDMVYRSMLESSMILDNNKKMHEDVYQEMHNAYKSNVEQLFRQTNSGLWMQQRMPKIKSHPSINYRRIPPEDEEAKIDFGTSRGQSREASDKGEKSTRKKKAPGQKPSTLDKLNQLGNSASVQLDQKILENFRVHWQIRENIWKPSVRLGATMTLCGTRVYLFGGYNRIALNDIQYIDLKKAQWVNIREVNGKRPPERYGHSAVFYKGNIVIFGGEQKYNQEIRMRETLCDLWLYNVVSNEFKQLTSGNKLQIEPRKDHVMAQVGVNLLVHGGINSKGHLLEDLVVFHFATSEWTTVQAKGPGPGPIAFHTCVAVYKRERRMNQGFGIFRNTEITTSFFDQKIKSEGIYFFGGKGTNGFPQNELRILKTGKSPLEWRLIETHGKQPTARYQHSMNYSEEQNLLIVFGGRCDYASKKFHHSNILNDVWVLHLETLTWYEAITTGSIPRERFSHSAAVVGTTLLTFGGINNENFCQPELYSLELDPYHSNRVNFEESRKKVNAVANYKNDEDDRANDFDHL